MFYAGFILVNIVIVSSNVPVNSSTFLSQARGTGDWAIGHLH